MITQVVAQTSGKICDNCGQAIEAPEGYLPLDGSRCLHQRCRPEARLKHLEKQMEAVARALEAQHEFNDHLLALLKIKNK